MENIVSIVVAILSGLAVCIPLAAKLVQQVRESAAEKNWAPLLGLVVDLMEQAEEKFSDGSTRKEWVIAMVKTSAEYVDYPLDTIALSDMIDGLVDMTKVINPPTESEAQDE